jgi:hypothetical protein
MRTHGAMNQATKDLLAADSPRLAVSDVLVHGEHELRAHVAMLADAMRLRDIGQWEGLNLLKREAARLDQLPDL